MLRCRRDRRPAFGIRAIEDGAPLPPRPSEAELAELSALRYQLRRIDVNLNQLAHRCPSPTRFVGEGGEERAG